MKLSTLRHLTRGGRGFLLGDVGCCHREMSSSGAGPAGVLVAVPEVTAFIERCMLRVGTHAEHASALAKVLVTGDHRGHFSHGLNRLEMYVNDVNTGITLPDGEPRVMSERAATAHVDGMNLLGPVVGNFCMQLAIEKARQAGVGWVVAKGSNHYGIAGWYSMQAAAQDMLGLSFTNTSPLQIPTRGKKCILGTNPITLAAPGKDNDSYVLDMATTTAALGKIEMNDRKHEPIPNGWGADKLGKETNNAAEVLDGGGLLPLGGAETSAGYKGYGLALLVEIFCGILGDAQWGPHIRAWKNTEDIANLGQCFIAVDPDAFAPGFGDRMQALMDTCRQQEPADGETEVLVPGDPERKHIAKCERDGGITYHPNLVSSLNDLAGRLNVEPMVLKT